MTNQTALNLVPAPDGSTAGLRMLLSVKMITISGEHSVTLRELSPSGAIISGENLPQAGADVVLRRGLFDVLARVEWSDGAQARLEFDEELDVVDLLGRINAASGPSGLPRSFS